MHVSALVPGLLHGSSDETARVDSWRENGQRFVGIFVLVVMQGVLAALCLLAALASAAITLTATPSVLTTTPCNVTLTWYAFAVVKVS